MADEANSDNSNPMQELNKLFIDEEDDEIFNENWFDPDKRGKWMLFYPQEVMNKKWQKAVALYRSKQLLGIQSLKCSTGAPNPRAGNRQEGAIRFACGPYDDEELILSYGKNLIEQMNYSSNFGFIAYKTDDQSRIGTRATGAKKNYYYRLPVTTYDSSLTGEVPKDDIGLPSTLRGAQHLFKKIESIASQYPTDMKQLGMWVMIFDKQSLDSAWLKAYKLYSTNELPGIGSIKVSSRANSRTGAIMFFCGPKAEVDLMKTYGSGVVKKMNYISRAGEMHFRVYENDSSIVSCSIRVATPWDARK